MIPVWRQAPGVPARIRPEVDGVPVSREVMAIRNLAQWKSVPDAPHAWLRGEIGTLFQKLYAMRVPGHPGADTLVVTAEAWLEVLTEINLTEADKERFESAARRLRAGADRWPTPAKLIEMLPRRRDAPGTIQADGGEGRTDAATAREQLRKIREGL